MHAEIIATGSELLLGEVVDTNSTYIARKLREIGLNLFFKTVVGDNEQRMEEALRIALNRSDVIITTGGLGPTVDDVTRPAVARAVDRELIFSDELLAQIQARFRAYGVADGREQSSAGVPAARRHPDRESGGHRAVRSSSKHAGSSHHQFAGCAARDGISDGARRAALSERETATDGCDPDPHAAHGRAG